jgi:hypothetical protein
MFASVKTRTNTPGGMTSPGPAENTFPLQPEEFAMIWLTRAELSD